MKNLSADEAALDCTVENLWFWRRIEDESNREIEQSAMIWESKSGRKRLNPKSINPELEFFFWVGGGVLVLSCLSPQQAKTSSDSVVSGHWAESRKPELDRVSRSTVRYFVTL